MRNLTILKMSQTIHCGGYRSACNRFRLLYLGKLLDLLIKLK